MRGDGAGVIFAYVDFMGDLLQRGKVLLDRLIHKNITVSKVQYLSRHAALQQAVNNLEGGIGLAGTGDHNQRRYTCCFQHITIKIPKPQHVSRDSAYG